MTTYNRNLKTLDNKTGREISAHMQAMMGNHEKYSKCYFWKPPGSAASRRNAEFTKELSFTVAGKKYNWYQELECSCKNMYWTNTIEIDGEKKNIRAIKALFRLRR